MNELIDKYERMIEDIDADLRGGHDNVADLRAMQDKGVKPWCEDIAEKEVSGEKD